MCIFIICFCIFEENKKCELNLPAAQTAEVRWAKESHENVSKPRWTTGHITALWWANCRCRTAVCVWNIQKVTFLDFAFNSEPQTARNIWKTISLLCWNKFLFSYSVDLFPKVIIFLPQSPKTLNIQSSKKEGKSFRRPGIQTTDAPVADAAGPVGIPRSACRMEWLRPVVTVRAACP